MQNLAIKFTCFLYHDNKKHKQKLDLPVTMLMSSSWLRWLDEPSDRLELAELNGCSDGQGDGGPP